MGLLSRAPLAASALLVLLAPGAGSQTNLPAPGPTLHTGANLVLVDVVVTDHDKPVLNLARGRFHVFDDGKEQPISSFDQHQPPAAPPAFLAPAALPLNTYTNVPEYPESSAVNVLLLDGLNTPMENQMEVRHKMIEYLGKVKPGTTMAIFTLGTQLHIVTQFTNDPAALLALFKKSETNPQVSPALEPQTGDNQANSDMTSIAAPGTIGAAATDSAAAGVVTDSPMNAAQALQQFQADSSAFQIDVRRRITLDAMMQLASYLGGIPGRKNVIWFSGSFPLVLLPDSSLFSPFRNDVSYREEIQKATDMLTAARVAVYPVDAQGLWVQPQLSAAVGFTPSGPAQGSQLSAQREKRFAEQSTMQQVADDTGGKAFLETNDFDKALASAVENGASYYTLAYVPKSAAFDGKFHKIEVRLDDGHGMRLAYRRGYYADATETGPAKPDEPASVFAAALAHDSPSATGLLFKVRVLPATDPVFQNVSLPVAAGERPGGFKGSAHRYIVDLTLDLRGLTYDIAADGTRKAAIELVLIAYDSSGQELNFWTHAYAIGLDPAKMERILASGLTLRLPFDLPAGNVDLRIGVHDLKADRAGSLEVPLNVAKP